MEDEPPKGWPVPVTDLLPLTLKSTPLCQIWENKSVPFRYLFLLAAGTMLSFVRRRQWSDISGRQGLTSWPQSTHQAVPLGARQARWVAARLPCDSSSALQAAGAGGPGSPRQLRAGCLWPPRRAAAVAQRLLLHLVGEAPPSAAPGSRKPPLVPPSPQLASGGAGGLRRDSPEEQWALWAQIPSSPQVRSCFIPTMPASSRLPALPAAPPCYPDPTWQS